MDLHLRGKRVLITGASKGIGAAAAEAFAEEGCDLRLAARNVEQMQALADRLRSNHQIDVAVHGVDLRKPDDLASLAAAAGDIDILVNNAGDIPGGSLDRIDEPTWRHAWDLKVFGFINLTRLVYAQMKARGHGVIVNDIGAAGEKFDANYISWQRRQCRADGVYAGAGRQEPEGQYPRRRHQSGPSGDRAPHHADEDPRQGAIRGREPLPGIAAGLATRAALRNRARSPT